jgi:hypothetical protein
MGYALCFEEFTYRFTITLPGKANDWTVSLTKRLGYTPYPNVIFGNGPGPNPYSIFLIECRINNFDFIDSVAKNNSAFWVNAYPIYPKHTLDTVIHPPVYSACNNRVYLLDQSVAEYDGDNLTYEIANSGKFGDSLWFKYRSPYSINYPLPVDTPSSFSIDRLTGKLEYRPIIPLTYFAILPTILDKYSSNLYCLPILVREFRNDTTWVAGNPVVTSKELGYITRFITFFVTPDSLCADSNTFIADTANFLPTNHFKLYCDDNPFKIAFNNTIRCTSVDSNGSCFLLIDSASGDTMNIVRAVADCRYDDIAEKVRIYTDSLLAQGTYYLHLKQGDDGNTLITQCGTEVLPKVDSVLILKFGPPEDPDLWIDEGGLVAQPYEVECRVKQATIFTSWPVNCRTVQDNASDLYLVDSSSVPIRKVAIDSLDKKGCGDDFTNKLILYFHDPIEAGDYKLNLRMGTDSNTFHDQCDRDWPYLSADISVPGVHVDLGPDIKICSRDIVDVILKAPAGYTYKWSTGQFKDSITVTKYGTYWVQVWSNTGCLGTDTINIVEINCTGIEEQSTGFSFSIRPNPAKDQITVELNRDAQNWQVELLDLQGRVVYAWTKLEGKSAVLRLPKDIQAGSYLVKVGLDGWVLTERVLILDSRF